jgi:hypothetical protein
MLKVIGRILLVIAIAAVLSLGVYFLISGSSSQTTALLNTGSQLSLENGTGNPDGQGLGPGNGTGMHRGEGEGNEQSGTAWLDLLKNVGIIGAAVVVIFFIRKALAFKKKQVQNSLTN